MCVCACVSEREKIKESKIEYVSDRQGTGGMSFLMCVSEHVRYRFICLSRSGCGGLSQSQYKLCVRENSP